MSLRILGAICLTVLFAAGAAHAKKSQFKVKNCLAGDKIQVKVYNGDDSSASSPRDTKKVSGGELESFHCKVDSGKRRCKVRFKDGSNDESKVYRVKDDRTIYITAIGSRSIDSTTVFVSDSTKTRVRFNFDSCTSTTDLSGGDGDED